MADDPRDDLISGTISLDEAAPRRPALPFADQARHRAPGSEAPQHPGAPVARPVAPPAPAWPTPPAYGAPPAMPSAMPQIVARAVGMAPTGAPVPAIAPPLSPLGGAYAFSNAAAGSAEERPAGRAVRDGVAHTPQRERVDYLWHDAAAESSIVCAPSIQDESTHAQEEEWLPDQGPDQSAAVRAVLRQHEPTPLVELAALYEQALDRGDERLCCLVRGDLVLTYDPVESLRVTLVVATPYLADARVKDAHDAAQEALRASAGLPPAVAGSLEDRLDEAMKTALRTAWAPLEAVIERALLEGRALAHRRVFGRSLVRALLHPAARAGGGPSASSPMPVYMADDAAETLPLMSRIPARLVVEVRPSQDAAEVHPLALRAVALARVVDLPKLR